jgi:hypothetical protein
MNEDGTYYLGQRKWFLKFGADVSQSAAPAKANARDALEILGCV